MKPDPNIYRLVSTRLPVALVERLEVARMGTLPLSSKKEFHIFLLQKGLRSLGK